MLLTVSSWRPKFSPQCRGRTIGVCMQNAYYIAGASALLSRVSRGEGITGYSCPLPSNNNNKLGRLSGWTGPPFTWMDAKLSNRSISDFLLSIGLSKQLTFRVATTGDVWNSTLLTCHYLVTSQIWVVILIGRIADDVLSLENRHLVPRVFSLALR